MDKHSLRDASLPQPLQSDSRGKQFWDGINSQLSSPPATAAPKRDLDTEWSDYPKAVGAGALELVGGIGELARQASNFGKENAGKQGGDYLEQARANMANKLSPLLDVVAGAGDLAASGAESLNDGMSADAKEAMGRRLVDETPEGRLTLGDGAGDIDVWAMKMAQGVGSLLPTLAAGGVTGVAAKASIGRAVTASMVKRGATQEVAEAVAAKAVSKIATGAAVTTGATGSVGSAGVNTRDTVLGMSFDELAGSDTFRQSFTRIDQDQQTAHLSDEEKLGLAREETANLASRATMSDAKVWGAAAMGSMMGDAMLFKMLAGKAATGGVLKGAAKGAAGEGISETLEEGVQQYVVNESLNEVAAADIDPMKGVMSSAIEGGLIGMGTGGAVGAVGGARGGKHASQEDGVGTDPVAEPSAPVTEGAAGPAVDPNFASVPLEDGEQAPSASQAEGELNPLGPSASQFPGVFERDQRGILRVKGDVDALASWAEQADMPYITDGDGIAIPAKYAKQAEKAIKGYRPVAAEPMAEPAPPADMPRFSQVDPIADEPAIKRQGFVMRNGDGQSTGEPEPYVRPQSGDELLYESSANWQAGQPHAESAPVDLEALRKESAQRWRDGNKPEAGTPVRTEEDTEQVLNALRAEGVNGWAGRQDPKLDMPKGQEFIPHGPQAGLPAVVGDGVQQAAGKAKGLPLSDTIFAGGPSHGGQADNTNYARPHLSRDQVDRSLGEESIRDPRSPVRQSIAKAGSATDSVFGPLKSLRITRKGKPFATEKEAAMASRKDQEMPVPLNGGGFGVAAIGEVQQAQAQQGAVKQPSSNSAQQDRQDGKTEIAQNGMVIVHGSGNPGMSEQDIQIVRASGQKQGKKGRVYGGFYGTSEQDAHQAQAYADMMGGTPTLYDVKIKPGTKVLHKQGDITRLSESYINELVSQGYGVVTGTDPRGQTEHVVIDKSAVASMAPRGAQATPSQVNDTNVADMRQPSDQPAASVSAETVPAPSATAGEASQLAPAIDTGYREVIPVKQPKTEVSNEPVTPVPAISSERSGDQPGAGDPVATSVGPTPAELAERAGPGDPADGTSLAPVPVTQPGEENSLTAPAPAGVAVSEEAQAEQARTTAGPAAAPTPWSEMIDNPDGTITLKGEVPIIKQWAKDNGVKAIPGKGGLVVSKTSADKVRQLTTHSTSEPVRQIEAARAEVAPVDASTLADDEAIAVADELGLEHGDNPDDARWRLDGVKPQVLADTVDRVRNPSQPAKFERSKDNPNIVAAPPVEGEPETRPNRVRMSQQRVAAVGEQAGLTADEVAGIVSDFRAEYKGARSLDFIVGQTQEDLYGPEGSPEQIGWSDGGYLPGKQQVHLFADSITRRAGRLGQDIHQGDGGEGGVSGDPVLDQSFRPASRDEQGVGGAERAKAEVVTTLRHEVLGHYGLDTFTPSDKEALLQKLIDAKQEKWIAPVWQQIAGDSFYGKQSALHQAEEVFAHLAERALPSRSIQAWNDIKTLFSRLLRKVGLVKGPIREHELDSLIKAVGKGIRSGERSRQNIRGDKEVIGKQADEPAKDDKPERIIRFSKQAMAQGDKPAKHLTRKEAELVSHGWFKQYRGASGIKVQIHATQAELEGALGLDAKDGLIRRAAFDDDAGTLHVAADTISDPKRMREILRHEVLAHYGLANVLGDGEYTKLMSRLIGSQKDPSMKPVWDWVNTHYADEDIGTQAEEVVAHLAEFEQGAWGRGWDRVVAWVTRALRAVGFVPDGITAAETRSLIEGLGKKLQRSGPDDSGPDGGKKFSQEAERPAQKGGIKMSQASTAADAAMEKLNLGPKPDIIDKTKASLNKLRQVDRGVVSSWIDRVIKKANTEVLDALAPIKYAEDAAGITEAADSGYVAARMATGAASTMQATMLYGLPEWKDGVIQRKAGTGEKDALLGIFADLGADLHNWLGWMAGHRAEILMGQGRENLLSEQDIAALKGLGKGKEAKFNEAKARWNRLNAATLDLAQEAGLFTKEARAEFESEWYIPFFRESEDGDVLAPFKAKGIANQNAGIKKLKGGEANTNDLLENIFTSTSKLIDASMKNMAAQKTVWNLADTGIIEVIPKPNKMDYQALANGKDRIMVKLEGEDYMIRVEDPDLYRAMTFFDRKPFGAMVNVAAKAKRLLTAGVTASPEFMLRNFLRDSLSSWAISKDGFRPVIDSIKGVKKTLAMDGSTIDVMFSGASFLGGYVNGNDPEAMADTVRKSLRRKGMTPEQIARYEKSIIRNAAQAKGVVANVWEKYNRYGEAFENANREAVYAAAIKAGKSHAQAAFESKDLMDFSMLGASRTMQVMTQLLPFFNARVQGLGKLTRELRDNPRAIAKRAGMITAASLALLAANWDDERYEELPDWDKDANWHFFVGDQHFRIPKPFEIGVLFGTIPERMVRALGDKDSGAQFGKAVARAIGDTFALNPIPQIAKPVVETTVNYDFFKGGPIDGPQDLNVQAEARYNEQTSLLMRELGELTGFSPKQLEHLVIGYTGTMGSYVMAAADGLIRASRPGESASWRADEIPLVKAVYRGTGPAKSTQHMEEFYRMLNEVNQLKRTIDQYRSEGLTDKARELLEEQGGILKSRRSLSRTQQQVRVVRNKIELIQRDRKMTAEEKRRRIDEMLARRNDLVYQAVNKNKANWE
ncbi:LPD38 domain-containing protein [Aeromonas caviae]|uniref:LPD38 domain-containing protein n=1 Tax=Aeromonas caviae TaxID=648 RepID=UPI0038D1982C